MTTWHWVRHAPTHAKSFVGWRDVAGDLSDAGQLDRLRAHLPNDAVLMSSDLRRTIATADALAVDTQHRLPADPHIREMHFGIWDGMHFEDVAARDPVLSRQFWEEPGSVVAPGGESWHMTAARVNAVVNRMNAKHPDTHIIAVAHFGVILTQIQRAMGISAYEALAYKIDNLSVTEITWQAGNASVGRINHLP
ncbi:MAG: histidine phosphatase family protein [Roseobacter sp.]